MWPPRWHIFGAKPSNQLETIKMSFSLAQILDMGRIGIIYWIMDISSISPWKVNPLHYTFPSRKCAISLTKNMVHTLLFEHVMQSHLPRMHAFFTLDIQCQVVNVSLQRLKRLAQFIIHLSNSYLNVEAKQLVVDRCRGQCCVELQSI